MRSLLLGVLVLIFASGAFSLAHSRAPSRASSPAPSLADELPGVSIEEGTKVTKSFTNDLELELVEVVISLDGEPQELPAGSQPSVTIRDEEEVVFVDEYVTVKGGRGTEILRTFETLDDVSSQAFTPPGGEEVIQEAFGESDLLGATVRFTWDGDEYSAAFSDEERAEDLLERLEGDADFLYLLADEPRSPGDQWKVAPIALDRFSSPSGDLKIYAPDADTDTDESFAEGFRDGLDGEIRATFVSLEDGVARITFEGVVTTSFEVEAERGGDATQTMDFEFDLTATLLWSVEAGVAAELTMESDVTMTITIEETMGEAEVEQIQTFEGTFESAATFE